MAQSVERVLGKDEVTGSNPVSSSIKKGRKVVALRPFLWRDSRTYQGQIKCSRKQFCKAKESATRIMQSKRERDKNYAKQKNFRENT